MSKLFDFSRALAELNADNRVTNQRFAEKGENLARSVEGTIDRWARSDIPVPGLFSIVEENYKPSITDMIARDWTLVE